VTWFSKQNALVRNFCTEKSLSVWHEHIFIFSLKTWQSLWKWAAGNCWKSLTERHFKNKVKTIWTNTSKTRDTSLQKQREKLERLYNWHIKQYLPSHIMYVLYHIICTDMVITQVFKAQFLSDLRGHTTLVLHTYRKVRRINQHMFVFSCHHTFIGLSVWYVYHMYVHAYLHWTFISPMCACLSHICTCIHIRGYMYICTCIHMRGYTPCENTSCLIAHSNSSSQRCMWFHIHSHIFEKRPGSIQLDYPRSLSTYTSVVQIWCLKAFSIGCDSVSWTVCMYVCMVHS
jgi:hypothetical protein